jgi:hypothetical protein
VELIRKPFSAAECSAHICNVFVIKCAKFK